MKILMSDKFYFVRGGAERYFFDLKAVLEANGHTVIPFSMKHPDNFRTPYDRYFVDRIEFNAGNPLRKARVGLQSLGRIFWSAQAADRLASLIRDTRPDIAHLHMIDHQISPSILPVLRRAGIPVVQTVHTYKLVCPTYRLYHMGRNRVCEKCLGGFYCRAVAERCHKDSFWATLLLALETTFHKAGRFYERGIDRFLVPSRFMGDKLAEGGIPRDRIRHMPYTINLSEYRPTFRAGRYALVMGRLSAEKGLLTLLRAVADGFEWPLVIAGEGPQRDELEAFAAKRGLKQVRFAGRLDGEKLRKTIDGAGFVVVPSEWHENSPLVIYESFAMAKPVIGAAMGGIPELISDGVDGALYPAGDAEALGRRLSEFVRRGGGLSAMGRAGRRKAERLFSPERHYHELSGVYRELIDLAKTRR
ncbi:glycosyltransferase family 4 protein [bacterium]|nr:glycosyltransferase family 4 protein [bacterium]